MSRYCVLLGLGLLVSCIQEAPPSKAAEQTPSAVNDEVAQIRVSKDRDDLVFTWLDPTGGFHDTRQIDSVPEESRAQVLVRDLSKSPDELRAHQFLYVADLREPAENGRYPCGVVSRRAFERHGIQEAAADAAGVAIERGVKLVVVYTTSWCGVCKRTKKFLRSQNVAFIERDVENDAGAEEELRGKAAAAGLSPQGVPVVDVAGTLMVGFDAAALTALLESQGLKQPG